MSKKIGLILIGIILSTAIITKFMYDIMSNIVYDSYVNSDSTTLISFGAQDDSVNIEFIPEYMLSQCFKYNCSSIMLYVEGHSVIYKIHTISRDITNVNGIEVAVYNYSVLSSILLDKVDLQNYHRAKHVPNLLYRINSYELDKGIQNILNIIMVAFIVILLTIGYFIFVLLMKKVVFNSKIIKFELEADLNKNITDVLHHELLAPYSIISNELDTIIHTIEKEKDIKSKREELCNQLNNCRLACDSIYNIINLFNRSKRLKTGSRFKPSLVELITDSFENVKLFNINPNIKLKLENKSMLNIYTVAQDFGNGGFCNIFTVLFNNAIEAYANTLTIKSSIHREKIYSKSNATLKIIVSDDGTGIRVSPISKIFKYGVSTKYINTEQTLYDKIINFSKRMFFILARIKLSELKYSPRGIGLAVVKKYIESYGGEIKAFNNEETGASFVMTIPIEEIKIG